MAQRKSKPAKWEPPVVVEIRALPDALGANCNVGTSATDNCVAGLVAAQNCNTGTQE